MQLSRHAIDKLETYGICGDRLISWQEAFEQGQRHLDLSTAATVVVTVWENRPWIAILSQDEERVITTYPTDHRTVTNRLGAGRWINPNT
ncbi:hypothetical protein [Cyanobium sp. FACHB-13342]|uniref:hypothetical protein n=1 Tax=Cyanobium sp. FACHB-13342 TaxID=2692793 RepID=UPI001681B749|nr:hypothetical protein [Cyanobium sp. FACHB-13342]MBD2422768.1 hypothetical protein [Cyanobium sp. FACHB-13342]